MPKFAEYEHVLKVRWHLFEEVELTLDHPGVGMFKPVERQYQAAFEIVFADRLGLADFVASAAWTDVADRLAQHCEAVHAARVDRCITTKLDGHITLAGVRGVAVADTIARLAAENQRDPEVSKLFLSSVSAAPV